MDARLTGTSGERPQSPLLTDLYELSMVEAYLGSGHTEPAAFEFFVRRLPASRGFLVAAGLEQVLDYLEDLAFAPADLDWLERTGRFRRSTLDWLADLRFLGDVDAMPEGSVVFGDEPILRIVAPLPVAQFVESRVMNILHFQTLIASKAARMVMAAPGKTLVDFGLRRAHGAEAGLYAARASYLAGFSGTATVQAGRLWGIPLFGTMAHAFVQAFDDEAAAFAAFAASRPADVILLIDTYDTEAAARKVVALAPALREAGIAVRGVRLDSGDLDQLSRRVREILDAGGLHDTTIFASGGLDEHDLLRFAGSGAPIDGFGLGTALTTSSDAPGLDCAYKLQEYAGRPRRKLSPGKATWPGRKQVWRRFDDATGRMCGDRLSTQEDQPSGEPMLQPVMRSGQRLQARPSLDDIRACAARSLARLPEPLRRLEPFDYEVEVGEPLRRLAAEVDAHRLRQEARA